MRPIGSPDTTTARVLSSRALFGPVAWGFLIGVLFGLLALLVGIPSALLVAGTGAAGALAGLVFGALRHLGLDYREAFVALIRKRNLE